MAQTVNAIRHLHKKSALNYKSIIEKLAYIAGILNPICTLPQLFQIWINKNTEGVSMFTWFSFFIISIIMTLYGFAHKEKPLILMYGFLVLINFFIVLGIFIY